jgi:diguanylate cyclase (GGDEF)-like protein
VENASGDFGLRSIRAPFKKRDDPYAGLFIEEPRRIGGLIAALMGLALLPLGLAAAPTAELGDEGWIVFGALVAADFAAAYALLRPGSRIGFDGFLVLTCIGIAEVALLEWMAGGHGTPYHQLFLAPAVLPPSVHPPRRALGLLVLATVAMSLPLLYGGWNGEVAAEIVLQAAFIWMLALITMIVLNAVREQRLVLVSEGEAANRLARRDQLTGLGNRRAFDETLEREIARSRRSGSPITVLVLDLDRFKAINDRHGHLIGDRTLKAAAEAITETVRVPDDCFRWGGDEFAVLLPDTELAGAREVGERMQAAVRAHSPLPEEVAVEISFGAAELGAGQSADELLHEADGALLRAKRFGAETGSDAGLT